MLDYNMYSEKELILNNMLDFISCKIYHDTNILQPYALNLANFLESQYII